MASATTALSNTELYIYHGTLVDIEVQTTDYKKFGTHTATVTVYLESYPGVTLDL
jgi:hypothetical protein